MLLDAEVSMPGMREVSVRTVRWKGSFAEVLEKVEWGPCFI